MAKTTCLCAEANEPVIGCIDCINLQHDLYEGYLEDLIQISEESRPKWRPFGDREAIGWLDMCGSKFREFVAKMIDDLCNSITLLSLKIQDLARRFVRMECEEL